MLLSEFYLLSTLLAERENLNWFALSLSNCSLLVLCDLLMMNDCESRQQVKEK